MKILQLMQTIAKNAEQMANDSIMAMVQDNDRNTTDVSIIEQSVQRDDEAADGTEENVAVLKPQGIPVKVNPLDNPAPKKNTAAVNDKKAAPVKVPAAVITKPAVSKPATVSKPAAPKPVHQTTTENKPKPATPKPATQKPKAVMPPKNDY
jgi:hypothetical protein